MLKSGRLVVCVPHPHTPPTNGSPTRHPKVRIQPPRAPFARPVLRRRNGRAERRGARLEPRVDGWFGRRCGRGNGGHKRCDRVAVCSCERHPTAHARLQPLRCHGERLLIIRVQPVVDGVLAYECVHTWVTRGERLDGRQAQQPEYDQDAAGELNVRCVLLPQVSPERRGVLVSKPEEDAGDKEPADGHSG